MPYIRVAATTDPETTVDGGGIAPVLPVVDAAPTDDLFSEAPPDGTLVLQDNENDTGDLYVRVNGGTWLKVTDASA